MTAKRGQENASLQTKKRGCYSKESKSRQGVAVWVKGEKRREDKNKNLFNRTSPWLPSHSPLRARTSRQFDWSLLRQGLQSAVIQLRRRNSKERQSNHPLPCRRHKRNPLTGRHNTSNGLCHPRRIKRIRRKVGEGKGWGKQRLTRACCVST